jgi:hypothetical protein
MAPDFAALHPGYGTPAIVARLGDVKCNCGCQAKQNPRRLPAGGSVRLRSDELDYQLR